MIRAFPEVDVLVNNMSIFEPKAFEEIRDADWLRLAGLSARSLDPLSLRATPGFFKNGRIVDVSFGLRALFSVVEAVL